MPAAPNVAVADGGTTPPVTVTVDTSVPPDGGVPGNAATSPSHADSDA